MALFKSGQIQALNFHTQLAAANVAAWNGDHAETIAICGRALDQQAPDGAERLEPLDVRSESYIALGRLDLAR